MSVKWEGIIEKYQSEKNGVLKAETAACLPGFAPSPFFLTLPLHACLADQPLPIPFPLTNLPPPKKKKNIHPSFSGKFKFNSGQGKITAWSSFCVRHELSPDDFPRLTGRDANVLPDQGSEPPLGSRSTGGMTLQVLGTHPPCPQSMAGWPESSDSLWRLRTFQYGTGSEDNGIGFLSWTLHLFVLLHPDEVIPPLLNFLVSTMRIMVLPERYNSIQRAARIPSSLEKQSVSLSLFHCKNNIRLCTF